MAIAPAPPALPADATPVAGKKGRGAKAWFAAHKVEAGASAAGVVAVYALWRKAHPKATAAGPTSTASGQPAGTTAGAGVATVLPSTPTSDWQGSNQLGQIETLLQQLQVPGATVNPAVPATPAPTSSSPPPLPAQQQIGSGYAEVGGANSPITTPAGSFIGIDWASAVPLILGGTGSVYYEPTPGTFDPATSGNALIPGLVGATPLYEKTS